MKQLLILLILIAVNFSFAEILTEKEDIPQIVFEHFYRDLPPDIPVVLEFHAGEYSEPLARKFKEQLLKDGYELYEEVQENCLLLKMSYGYTATQQRSGFFPFSKTYLEENHLFSYQISKIPESRIKSLDTLTLTTFSKDESDAAMRWYDPLLISAIIGTLAYLFYFGGN